MTENPFAIIENRIDRLEVLLLQLIANQTESPSNPLSEKELMTVKEAAAFLNLAVATVHAMTSRREIPHCKRRGRLYFSKDELREWIAAGRQKTRQDIKADTPAFMRVSKHKKVA